jgi:GNAT superfamily N-acetyltransferase
VESRDVALLVEFSEARAYESLMRAAPPAVLERLGMRAVAIGSAVAVVAESITTSLNMNRVIGLGVAEPATEAMLERIVDLYSTLGLPFGVELGPFAAPEELTDWLRSRRLRRGVATAIHYRVADRVHPSVERVSVVRARPSDREIVADICCSVFRMPAAANALIAGTADHPEWRQWLAYSGSRAVAAALSFVRDGVAWLGWDATLPEYRGLGAQSSLIAHRVNDAAEAGCSYVTTETAVNAGAGRDPSYRNYERSGFSLAYERATYIALRAKKPSLQ